MAAISHTLDYNRLYGLTLDYDPATLQLRISPDSRRSQPGARLDKAFRHQLRIDSKPPQDPQREQWPLVFTNIRRDFTLLMGQEPVGSYRINPDGGLARLTKRPLTVDETRRMGAFHHCEPYPQRRSGMPLEENNVLLAQAERAVFTDFHTHNSGQISARGLLEVAMKRPPYYYPIELLREAGIDTSYEHIPRKQRKDIKRIPFPPKERPGLPDIVEAADLHALTQADIDKLAYRMAMPADQQSTMTEMELDGYRFRYPFTKDRALLRDILKQIALEYARQGVSYAELSFVGLDDPELLRIVHEALEETQRDPATQNVTLRFMVGIPRTLPLPKIREMLDKTKILADSPYIIGVDFLGNEVNKTREFIDLFAQFADWANSTKPGFTLRVHAGENGKNPENVTDFLKMAINHANLQFRIGHGIYGMGREAIRLARQLCADPNNPRLTLEFNPSSNIALNNVDDLSQIPFYDAVKNQIPFVVSSDSSGMYQTDAAQLGIAAYHAGLDAKGFSMLERHQLYLLERQMFYSGQAGSHIPQWDTLKGKREFLQQLVGRLANVPRAFLPPDLPVTPQEIEAKMRTDQVTLIHPGIKAPELASRKPVTIIGASGESWSRIKSKGQKREVAIAVDMLIHALDPEKSYITQGRNKRSGLSKVINQSVQEANEIRAAKGQSSFYKHGLLVDPSFDETQSYKHLTHLERLPGKLLDLADGIVEHTFANDGVLVAVGGSAFTRDIITKADKRGIREKHPDNTKMMMLLSNCEGASAEKARLLHPDYNAIDGRMLLKKLYATKRDLFRDNFSLRELNQYYEQAKARVATYRYNTAESTVVTGPKELLSTKQKSRQP